MFKKPVSSIKSFSPLRSSDRRHFRSAILDAYPQLKDTEDTAALVPESLQNAKFVSHIDHAGHVYKAAGDPLWLVLDNLKPVPTVYTLWQHATLLPILYTWLPVVQRLAEGADLMIPGLVAGPDGTLPRLESGDLVAITIKGYPYPLAVGTMALPTSEIRPRSGMKGKAVHIIHVYKDHLWAMGNKAEPPEMLDILDSENEDESANDDQEDQEDQEEQEGQEGQEDHDAEDRANPATAPVQVPEAPAKQVKATRSVSDTDEVLIKSLCFALQYKITAEMTLPLSASSLYSSYILPNRPRDAPDVDIKQSSWKKVQKFLKAMEKTGLLKTKDQRGEMMVMSINWSHPKLQGLVPYKPIPKDEKVQPAQSSSSANTASPGAAVSETKIEELYKPLGKSVVALFEAAKQDTNALYNAVQVRQVVLDYIKENSHLVNPKNQKQVVLDDILGKAVLSKSESDTIGQLPRESILQRLLEAMQPFHQIAFHGKEPLLLKGKPKPVEITQEIRQGRKTVTRVTGMEHFDLQIEELCKDLTKLCASSVTHNPIHGTSPKNPLHEIMVQGPQIKHVSQTLIARGVPKGLIYVNDKTSKKGKK